MKRLLLLLVPISFLITSGCPPRTLPPGQQKPLGSNCTSNGECQSGHCPENKCAPENDTGSGGIRRLGEEINPISGDYCHHGNHCMTGKCVCPDGTVADKSFCPDYRSWPEGHEIGKTGTCSELADFGAFCSRNEECMLQHCADGKRCAPKHKKGEKGQYCHHNNHCKSGDCICPGGRKSYGFCANYESFSDSDIIQARANGAFSCSDPFSP